MRLVIDTNIIISSLISSSTRRYILMNSNIEFIAPEYAFTEILKHADLIKKKAKLASEDLRYVMDMQCETKGYGGGRTTYSYTLCNNSY